MAVTQLLALLEGSAGLRPTAEDLADALWLARHLPPAPADQHGPAPPGTAPDRGPDPAVGEPGSPDPDAVPTGPSDAAAADDPPGSAAALYLPPDDDQPPPGGIPARGPRPPSIPDSLRLTRALRRLSRTVPSHHAELLDEDATAGRAADTGLWLPVLRPAPDRWLDLALVVDVSASMTVWRRTVAELRQLLEHTGAFRDVRVWWVDADQPEPGLLTPRAAGTDRTPSAGRDPHALLDPAGRRLTLLVSDCVGAAWHAGGMARLLALWGAAGPVAILHPLPQRLWARCAPEIVPVRLRATQPGMPNRRLTVVPDTDELAGDPDPDATPRPPGVPVPVLELDADWLEPWAALIAGAPSGHVRVAAVFTGLDPADRDGEEPAADEPPLDRVLRFRATASPDAFRLVTYLALVPLTLSVMRLALRAELPRARPAVLAEVFLSGLLRRSDPHDPRGTRDPDEVRYDFLPGVRELLLISMPRGERYRRWLEISGYVADHIGSPLDFRAILADSTATSADLGEPFASVAATVLRSLGGRYAEFTARSKKSATSLDKAIYPEDDRSLELRQDMSAPAVPGNRGGAPGDPSAGSPPSFEVSDQGAELTATTTQSTTQPISDRPLPAKEAGGLAVLRNVPPRDPRFTGRSVLLDGLRERLSGSVTALVPQALHGLGGVGKTSVAVEYAYRYQTDYDLIIWIPAQQRVGVRAALVGLAGDLGVEAGGDVDRTVAAVLDALRRGRPYGRWLLVLDNAEDPAELAAMLPTGGHVLVTSRDQSWQRVAEVVAVEVFTRTESIALLQAQTGGVIGRDDAERLAELLGDLPLAVGTAAAWHATTGMPTGDYVRLLEQRPAALLGEGHPTSADVQSVASVWQLALERLAERAPAAVQLLELCAFFGPEPIAIDLLGFGRDADLPEPLAATVADELALRRAVGQLDRHALARVNPAADTLQVHRLVQTVLRQQLDSDSQAAMRHRVHQILAAASPGDPANPDVWPRYATILPHVLRAGVVHGATEAARAVVFDQLRYLYRWGDHQGRADLARLALDGWQDQPGWRVTLGGDHEATLRLVAVHATSLRSLGHHAQARALHAQTLDRMRQVLGEEHLSTLAARAAVAANLRMSGDFAGALQHDTDVLDGYRRLAGPDDPNTLRVANNLGVSLRLLGRYADAHALDTDTLARRRRVAARWDSTILMSLGNLAHDLTGLGEPAAALELLTEHLPGFQERLGAGRDQVLHAQWSLSIAYRHLGDVQQAHTLATSLHARLADRSGPAHHDTLTAAASLVNARRHLGDLTGAQTLAEDTLAGHRALFGHTHPFTAACQVNLATVLRAAGDHPTARTLDETALASLTSRLGDDHPSTIAALGNLTNDLSLAGDHNTARQHSETLDARSQRVRGPAHPDTLACQVNLALDLRATGDTERADRLRDTTIHTLEQTLGAGHPATALAVRGRRADHDIDHPLM